jgi:hypothetical protein
MRKTARLKDSRAVKQLLDIKARATKQTQDTLEYLEWLPDDDQTRQTVEEQADGLHAFRRASRPSTSFTPDSPLDELHARLTQR